MYTRTKSMFLIAETPLHAGCGSGLGIVDLPIQRERHTYFPKIEASTIKGSIRTAFESRDGVKNEHVNCLFGPDPVVSEEAGPAGGLSASAIGFSDARILLFPVRSMQGVFAWVTCRNALERFIDELSFCGQSAPKAPPADTVVPGSDLLIGDRVVLEEYAIAVKADPSCAEMAKWLSANVFMKSPDYWRQKVLRSLVVLSDDAFRDFVRDSTEVITRVKINNETGSVQENALFTQELLPTDSVMYCLVLGSRVFCSKGDFDGKRDIDSALAFFFRNLPEIIQIGGDATHGKGLVRLVH